MVRRSPRLPPLLAGPAPNHGSEGRSPLPVPIPKRCRLVWWHIAEGTSLGPSRSQPDAARSSSPICTANVMVLSRRPTATLYRGLHLCMDVLDSRLASPLPA